jgi:hypothetical protein
MALGTAIKQAGPGDAARGGLRSASFKPGVSGNPGGRPKRPATIETYQFIADVELAARSHAAYAIQTLVDAIKSEKVPWAARISAASAILDRGWGRSTQAVEHAGVVAVEKTNRLDISGLRDDELDALESARRATGLLPR